LTKMITTPNLRTYATNVSIKQLFFQRLLCFLPLELYRANKYRH